VDGEIAPGVDVAFGNEVGLLALTCGQAPSRESE
jgi:hypothetical protein